MVLDNAKDILSGDLLQDIDWFEWELATQDSPEKIKKTENKKYMKYVYIASAVIWVLLVLLVFLWIYNRYIYLNSKDNLDIWEKEYVDTIKWYSDSLSSFFWDSQQTVIFSPNLERENSNLIINNMISFKNDQDISYITKREVMVQFVSNLSNTIKSDSQKIDKLKTDVWIYWFLPSELNDVVTDSAIQRSFLSIEAIKYITAIKVFYYIDSFLTEFSTVAWYSKETVMQWMQDVINSWEINIQKYLMMCYLNPYEKSDECNAIWDFDYDMIKSWENLNITFLKSLIAFIKWKLENQEFPKLSIIFNTLDPQSNKISFTISMNTFLEDESNLINSWILNPHIYIVSVMLNLLRESHFILWDTIRVDSLKVTKKKYKDVIVNSSSFSFDIPVQKAVEREIYDYVYWN